MREILFRGMRSDCYDWVEGFLIKRPDSVHIGNSSPWYIIVPPADPEDYEKVYNVDEETIGQFTGLLDKNGKKIFEGDKIVSYDLFGNIDGVGIVNWNDLFTAWHMDSSSMYGRIASYEVVGNVHVNAELPKGD